MKNNKKNIQNTFFTILFFIFTISLLFFSKSNIKAVKSGLNLFFNYIIPSLLPFFIATELLSTTNIIKIFGMFLNRLMRPIFNLPGESAYAFLIGIISGYPVRSKSSYNLAKKWFMYKI